MKPPTRSPSSISSSWMRAQRIDARVPTTPPARPGMPSWLSPRERLARPLAPQPVLPGRVTASMAPVLSVRPDEPPAPRVTPLPAVPDDLVTAAALAADEERAANLQAELAELRARLAHAEAALPRIRSEVLAASEGELVRLAIAIARRVVARELHTEPGLIARWAHDAIAQLADGGQGAVVVAARDVMNDVPPETWNDALGEDTQVRAHSTMPPGGCEVRAGAATAAVGLDARFGAVARELEEQLS